MLKIFKYELQIVDRQEISIPSPKRLLHVGEQDEKLFVWSIVTPDIFVIYPTILRIFGTGHQIENEDITFIGTVQMSNGLVWHIFTEDNYE